MLERNVYQGIAKVIQLQAWDQPTLFEYRFIHLTGTHFALFFPVNFFAPWLPNAKYLEVFTLRGVRYLVCYFKYLHSLVSALEFLDTQSGCTRRIWSLLTNSSNVDIGKDFSHYKVQSKPFTVCTLMHNGKKEKMKEVTQIVHDTGET